MAEKKPKPLSDQLRQAIRDSGVSQYRLTRETGIDQGALSKFLSGERGLSLASIDVICAQLGIELAAAKRRKE